MNFRSARKNRRITEVNLTPLIDIVFQLLIFFLITTTFVQNPGIEVDLPEAGSNDIPSEADVVIIGITTDGRMVHEGKMVTGEELKARLEDHHQKRPSATVIIQADSKSAHGAVVKAMDLARSTGFKDLAIATQSGN